MVDRARWSRRRSGGDITARRSRTATTRLVLLALGALLLAVAAVLAVVPGGDPVCGSVLVPRFAFHHACSGAALTLLPPLVVVALVGTALAVTAVVMSPQPLAEAGS